MESELNKGMVEGFAAQLVRQSVLLEQIEKTLVDIREELKDSLNIVDIRASALDVRIKNLEIFQIKTETSIKLVAIIASCIGSIAGILAEIFVRKVL